MCTPSVCHNVRRKYVLLLVKSSLFFFEKHSINADTHTHTSTHLYEHMHAHPIPMSTSERLSRLDLEIHEVGHQEHLVVNGDVASY
jgi:hypothetical protein